VKKQLEDFEFPPRTSGKEKRQKLAFEITKVMFDAEKSRYEGFYKKTLNNMVNFWFKLDR